MVEELFMRRSFLLPLALLALAPGMAGASTWDIDASHSNVEFSVRHLMVSTVKGNFPKVSGVLELDDKNITKSSIEVAIEAASVDTREPKRDGHLKSPDFFDVAKYPSITFKSTKVEKAGANKLKVTGDLTIRGITKPVVLQVEGPSAPLKDPFGRTVRGVTATGKLNRKDWGISWNKALDTGGVMVSDEVKLELNAELAERKAPAPPAGEKPAEKVEGKAYKSDK
jgi:polyisoprenoid-binding protein YceI